ncbi:shematrin-like protein 2 isoform X4 [Artemia franciscana]|uniref:shematrin-like protein 2 isoform X4 n=1 Tax=Artemia franciscana TaxID=6661 RepID=UPI0032DAC8F7
MMKAVFLFVLFALIAATFAKAQDTPIEDGTPLENAPIEGDEDAAARYRGYGGYGGYGGYRRPYGGYGGRYGYGRKRRNAESQDIPIENGTPLENAPVEGDEDAAARYRSYGGYGGYRRPYGGYGGRYGYGRKRRNAESQDIPIENGTPLENAPVEGDEDAAARYRSYGGYGGYRRPYGGYGGYGRYGYGRKRRDAESQDTPIENGAPIESAPIEGDEDAAARYRSYGGYGGYRRPYGGYGGYGSYGGYRG